MISGWLFDAYSFDGLEFGSTVPTIVICIFWRWQAWVYEIFNLLIPFIFQIDFYDQPSYFAKRIFVFQQELMDTPMNCEMDTPTRVGVLNLESIELD